MNLRESDNHSVSSHNWGWTARPFHLRLTAVGEVFVLTSPFIERDYRNVAYPTLYNYPDAIHSQAAVSCCCRQRCLRAIANFGERNSSAGLRESREQSYRGSKPEELE